MAFQNPQATHGYLICQAAKMSGVSSVHIRLYESKGLSGRYRFYRDEDVPHLRFIQMFESLHTHILLAVSSFRVLQLGQCHVKINCLRPFSQKQCIISVGRRHSR
jgi:MerR HTH family regulatory protein